MISDQIVLDYVFKKFLKGLLTLELHIYHGVSPYFFHWVLRSFAWYIDILWFFSHRVFLNLQDNNWWTSNDAYKKIIDQEGVLELINSDQLRLITSLVTANDSCIVGIGIGTFWCQQTPFRH